MARLEADAGDSLVTEEVVGGIVTRIQEIGEAAEEDNLINLSRTVKTRRREEERLQESIESLQRLGSALEGIRVEDKLNQKVEELRKLVSSEYREDVDNWGDEDVSKHLEQARRNVDHFVELFK